MAETVRSSVWPEKNHFPLVRKVGTGSLTLHAVVKVKNVGDRLGARWPRWPEGLAQEDAHSRVLLLAVYSSCGSPPVSAPGELL